MKMDVMTLQDGLTIYLNLSIFYIGSTKCQAYDLLAARVLDKDVREGIACVIKNLSSL